jgi:hypothetical protein
MKYLIISIWMKQLINGINKILKIGRNKIVENSYLKKTNLFKFHVNKLFTHEITCLIHIFPFLVF